MTYENVNIITISKTKIPFVRVLTKKFRGLNLKYITLKTFFPLETRSLFLFFDSIYSLKSRMDTSIGICSFIDAIKAANDGDVFQKL